MTVVVDASALVAMALAELERSSFERIVAQTDTLLATPVNLMEAGIILILREKRFTADEYHRWLEDLDIVSSDLVNEREALDAYMRWGKGVHRAGLNMGDCFAYAVARNHGVPLLYKGEDFALTELSGQ